jgi:hypothetical protein
MCGTAQIDQHRRHSGCSPSFAHTVNLHTALLRPLTSHCHAYNFPQAFDFPWQGGALCTSTWESYGTGEPAPAAAHSVCIECCRTNTSSHKDHPVRHTQAKCDAVASISLRLRKRHRSPLARCSHDRCFLHGVSPVVRSLHSFRRHERIETIHAGCATSTMTSTSSSERKATGSAALLISEGQTTPSPAKRSPIQREKRSSAVPLARAPATATLAPRRTFRG